MDYLYFFERDMKKLSEEINLYKNENDLLKIKEGISNSAGNITLHLIGNLNHFIGKTLANTNYIRERDKEFYLKNVSRKKLTDEINNISTIIKNTLPELSNEDLKKDFPIKINDKVFSTENLLVYLLAHLNYHLGQVNYHRRMI
ncbi:MAG TPA: DUF1572 family protein [Hanamia sp.]